jgi:hypothetical protein
MPAEIISAADCASLFGRYEVPGSKPGTKWTVDLYGETAATCDCPSYTYFKGDHWDRTCKHVVAVFVGACKYNSQWSEGNPHPTHVPISYNATPIPGEKCPACGGPVVSVRRAV